MDPFTAPSQLLPIDRLPIEYGSVQHTLADVSKHLGFLFFEPNDETYRKVIVPPGWGQTGSGVPGHCYIIDPRGRRRGLIFYGASFMGRKPDWALSRRYFVKIATTPESPLQPRVCVVDAATRQPVHVAGHLSSMPTQTSNIDDRRDYYAAIDRLENEARAWLDVHYPEHENVFAYWD